MPIQEFQTEFSLGYNGTDYFSPEMDFAVEDAALAPYAEAVNQLLDAKGLPRYRVEDLHGEMNQLKALVDLAHLHGLAVVLDLVYNHAGGDFGDESLYFFDRQSTDGGHRNSLYFTDKGHAGGLVFDFGKPEVRDFLIQNAKFFLDEYRVDGFRHDQVSVIDHDGAPHGWSFCQDLTSTLRAHRPGSFDKAEYWSVNPYDREIAAGGRRVRYLVDRRPAHRDSPGHRRGQRSRRAAARHDGPRAQLVAGRLRRSTGSSCRARKITTSSIAIASSGSRGSATRAIRVRGTAAAAHASPRRISLTAPGIPMLFMGQEFLEDKQWSDNCDFHDNLLLHWAGLDERRSGRWSITFASRAS